MSDELILFRLPDGTVRARYLGAVFHLDRDLSNILTRSNNCTEDGIFSRTAIHFRGDRQVDVHHGWTLRTDSSEDLSKIASAISYRVSQTLSAYDKISITADYQETKVTL